MAIYIEQLNIESFRGIHNLSLAHLNHINIIAGDNNSGKTSVLEAMLLLRNPKDFTNILRVARMREISLYGVSTYESFINLFSQNQFPLTILVNAVCKGKTVQLHLQGDRKKMLLELQEVYKQLSSASRNRMAHRFDSDLMETEGFIGQLQYEIGQERSENSIEFHSYSPTSGREISKTNYLNMVYLSPSDHVRGTVFNRILQNDSYKEICLRILCLFDPDIVDLLLLKNEDTNRPVEYVKNVALGNMPLSTYGDGIKKVLSLANGIAQAAGGVLLIDEVETAIHSKYYDDIFRFIVKACKQFKVQAFITIHSIEAIDGFLATQDYDTQSQSDDISVLTFKKDTANQKTHSRVLSGRHVHSNREQFGFEVRL